MGTPVSRWSKAVLVSNTFITAYALQIVVVFWLHHHDTHRSFGDDAVLAPESHHGHHDRPYPAHAPQPHRAITIEGADIKKLEVDTAAGGVAVTADRQVDEPARGQPEVAHVSAPEAAANGRRGEAQAAEAHKRGSMHHHPAHHSRARPAHRPEHHEVEHHRSEHHEVEHHSESQSHSFGPHRGMRGHGPERRDGPDCCVAKFALLLLLTGLTGMAAGLSGKRRVVVAFLVLLLTVEFLTLLSIGKHQANALRACVVESERVAVVVSVTEAKVGDAEILEVDRRVSEPFIDGDAKRHCDEGVRHAAVLACLTIGVIFSSLACCGSRLLRAVREEEVSAAAAQAEDIVVVVVAAAPQQQEVVAAVKADPLDDFPAAVEVTVTPRWIEDGAADETAMLVVK